MPEGAFTADRRAARRAPAEGAHDPGRAIAAQWKGNSLSPAPADRAAAEQGVRLAYRDAGLAAPCIVWHDGPVSLAGEWASASACAGANVRDAVIDVPCRQAAQRLDMHADRSVRLLRERFCHDPSFAVSAAMRAAVIEDAGALRPSLRAWLRRLGSSWADGRWPAGFAGSGAGQHDLCWLGLTVCLLEMLEPRAVAGLGGARLIAGNAGWIVPHAQVCWLSDRPASLSYDRWGRLHSPAGPALHYRDGWSVHAWKGARVPSWIVDEPERITLGWIDAEIDPSVRHAMIDIFTPERFADAGGADRLASDAAGTLWRRTWSYRASVIDAWAALEFPARGGVRLFRCVPAHLRTPSEARAWLRMSGENASLLVAPTRS